MILCWKSNDKSLKIGPEIGKVGKTFACSSEVNKPLSYLYGRRQGQRKQHRFEKCPSRENAHHQNITLIQVQKT
jgi:hypothetical protein